MDWYDSRLLKDRPIPIHAKLDAIWQSDSGQGLLHIEFSTGFLHNCGPWTLGGDQNISATNKIVLDSSSSLISPSSTAILTLSAAGRIHTSHSIYGWTDLDHVEERDGHE